MKKNTITTIVIASIMVLLVACSVIFAVSSKGSLKTEKENNTSSDSDSLLVSEEPVSSEEVSSETRKEVTLEFPYFIEIDKGAQICTIFTTNEEGKYEKVVRKIPISSGVELGKLPDGYYKSKDTKHRWQTMFSLNAPIYCQYTTRITGNFLFHSLPYRKNGNPASLNAAAYNKLGTRASGGCIRMTVENAKWIYENINPGTTIHVVTGPERPDELAAILPPKLDSNAKWDPSDPDPANPDYKSMYPDAENEPKPDPYAELYPYNFEYNKDIPVTPQKTTTTKSNEAPAESKAEDKPAESKAPETTQPPAAEATE